MRYRKTYIVGDGHIEIVEQETNTSNNLIITNSCYNDGISVPIYELIEILEDIGYDVMVEGSRLKP